MRRPSRIASQAMFILIIAVRLIAQTPDAAIPVTSQSTASLTLEKATLAIPQVIAYQAYLTDKDGNPITGTLLARVSIWTAASGGTKLWQEDQNLDIYQGYFTAELGRQNAFSRVLFDGSPRWIQLEINGEIMQPRKEVLSVPFSIYASDAGSLGQVSADQFYTKTQADDAAKNSIDAAKLGGKKAETFYDRFQIEAGYIPRGGLNTINGDMITDGSVQRQDLGFSLGTGTITAVNAGTGLAGGGAAGAVTLSLAADFANGQVYDTRFVRRDENNAVTSMMLAPGSITSEKIVDGAIQPHDLAFPASTITQIIAGTGLTGGGTTGAVTLTLNSNYQSGIAYDSRFVRKNEESSITGAMIRDGEITGADIKNSTVTQEDLAFNIGDITGVTASNGISGGGLVGDVLIQLEAGYRDGSIFDSRFVRQDQANVITSAMIKDGTIMSNDLAFPAGDITAVQTTNGLTGGGAMGDLLIQLEPGYRDGSAYDNRFPNKNLPGTITSYMITDYGITGADLADNMLLSRHFPNYLSISKSSANAAVLAVSNTALYSSWGLEGQGVTGGVHGISTTGTGVLGEGSLYGVHARLAGPPTPNSFALYVDGPARCTTGGWGDLAETISSNEVLEAGDVVIINPAGANEVKRTATPYDRRVAGIISTDPTLMVGKTLENGYPLALAGIVPCKVTAQNGAIAPGDLLTTSDLPGYAMKATEITPGAMVAKALEGLASGTGKIQVLVVMD